MKKLILAIVSCVVLMSLLCSCGLIGGSKLAFTENGDEYTVSGRGDSKDAEIEVPEKYKGKSVTAVGDRAFYYNFMSNFLSQEDIPDITSITLPDTITSIGKEAFANNSKLETLNIPDSVEKIGAYAFYGCSSLKSITVPDGVTEIKESTFAGCTALTSITIPDSVTKIGAGAFSGCSSLKTIELPASVIEISDSCFAGCTSLESFPVNEKTVSIGNNAFEKCSSIGEVTIPSNVITLGEYVFKEVGENVTVKVSYDTTAPANWNEKWHAGMNGGKAINTSEVYYASVVVPNQAKKVELEANIKSCNDQYNSIKETIASNNQRINTIRGNGLYSYETITNLTQPLIQENRNLQQQQSSIIDQRNQYQEQLDALPLTNQIN